MAAGSKVWGTLEGSKVEDSRVAGSMAAIEKRTLTWYTYPFHEGKP